MLTRLEAVEQMYARGYVYAQGLDLCLDRYIDKKKQQLHQGIYELGGGPLVNASYMSQVDKYVRKAQDYGLEILQIKKTVNISEKEEGLEFWITKEIHHLLCLLFRDRTIKFKGGATLLFTDEQMALVAEYHEHPELRESILAMLELAMDANNGDSSSHT